MRTLLRTLAILLVSLVTALPALAAETQIVVYNKGKTLRYDPDVGAELKEIVLETYDIEQGKLVKKETIEAYFFLSEDKEIITPEAITDEARKKFVIEKKDDKYIFGGVRDAAITLEEANAAAPAPTMQDAVHALEGKVKRISAEVVKIDPNKKGSSTQRSRIINAAFTTALENFGETELTDVAGFVLLDEKLNQNQKYYVLRSFGFTFFEKKDYKKSVFFYEKCCELDDTNYSAFYQKAVSHQRGGEPDQAIRSFAKAISLKPQEKLTRMLAKMLSETPTTEKLDASKIGELKAKVAELEAALKKKDKGAQDLAHKLEDKVEGWYGGAASSKPASGGAPPPSTPPSPPAEDPIGE